MSFPDTVAELDYDLPDEAIAQRPAERRDDARLLVASGDSIEHRHVGDLTELVGPGDVVVVNDTLVRPVRLRLRKDTGGAVEVVLLEPRGDTTWLGLVRPSRRVAPGSELAAGSDLRLVIGADLGEGRREIRVSSERGIDAALADHGEMPLPPYITETPADPSRYQTVYATHPGSAAAPTAGLHLTEELMGSITATGASISRVQLDIGLDTFRPITAERLSDHEMHTERYRVPTPTWQRVCDARRVIAVGTTVVRSLETAARTGCLEGRTDLFIRRPFDFRAVDVLMTNFHMPRSTLLAMIDAFVGARWRDLYRTALDAHYRFLSFGDAMWLDPRGTRR